MLFAMMNVDSTVEDGFVRVRFSGALTDGALSAMARAMSEQIGGNLMLFDWLGIESWDFSASKGDNVAALRTAAKQTDRVALLHSPRFNRPAAWVAAILRAEGVTVRSWRAQQAPAAADWLKS